MFLASAVVFFSVVVSLLVVGVILSVRMSSHCTSVLSISIVLSSYSSTVGVFCHLKLLYSIHYVYVVSNSECEV